MQTLLNGVSVPTNSDAYNLTDDLAESFSDANVVVAAPGDTVRDTYRDSRPGLVSIVCRTDVPGVPMEIWDGTAWHRFYRTHAEFANTAILNSPVPAGGQLGPFFQTFPVGRFTVPPVVVLSQSNARLGLAANNVTKDGFDLYVRNDTGVETVTGAIISYMAKQMTATTAAG